MRKIFAIVLTVLMLVPVIAMIPAAAAETTTGGLMITEVAHNTSDLNGKGDGFSFWEVYNAGEAIDMYALSLAISPMYGKQPTSKTELFYSDWDHWQTKHSFIAKSDIHSGSVLPSKIDAKPKDGITFENGVDDNMLNKGEIAVVWILSEKTVNAVNAIADKTGIKDAREAFLYHFKTCYNSPLLKEEYDPSVANIKIYMVWGGDSRTDENGIHPTDRFYDQDCSTSSGEGYMFGIVKDDLQVAEAKEGFLDMDIAESVVNENGVVSDKVVAMAAYGAGAPGWMNNKTNVSTMYAPATAKPDYYIANEKYNEREVEDYETYIAAGLVTYENQSAVMQCNQGATPGVLSNIQCAYLDFSKASADVQSAGAAAYIKKYMDTFFIDLSGDLEDANEEPTIVIDPPSREELADKFGNKPVAPTVTVKKGCGSSIASCAIVITSILGLGIGFVRKEKDQ